MSYVKTTLLIFGCVSIIAFTYPHNVNALVNSSIEPAQATVPTDSLSSFKLSIIPEYESINRIYLLLHYSPTLVEIQSIQTDNSFIDFWYQIQVNKVDGIIILEGGKGQSNQTKSPYPIAQFNFIPKKEGKIEFSISHTSKMYAQNGDELGVSFDTKALYAAIKQEILTPRIKNSVQPTKLIEKVEPNIYQIEKPVDFAQSNLHYRSILYTGIVAFLIGLFILKKT
ncbi:hypothetical protein HGA91_00750 [candidate division WWE3 bacterium]|nr:hypothetical protein [candidate division WWE3 bacterium]